MSTSPPRATKHVVCTICDIACQLRATTRDGKVDRILAHENPLLRPNICMKGVAAPEIHNHPERLRTPLKRVGARGENKWQEITYEHAMDEIARRLAEVVERDGPEALAVMTSSWNTSVDNGMGRRFLNLLGSPNWTSGVAMCMGNTAAVNRLTYGWFPFPDFASTKLIVLFGHNPRRHSWTPIYNAIKIARSRGARLIVLDPRVSEQAETADLHLPLRSGTDAAMCLGWLNVIISERLYDEEFVRDWTVGFDALAERVAEYPVERVADITGVDADLIRTAARMYADADGAVIPWTPITDQQVSSTSAIRLQCILRAICGHLDAAGGDVLAGFNPDYIPESRLELHEALPQSQRDKQLGADKHPVYTYRAMDILGDATERVWGYRYANLLMGCYMANPSALFRAMADGDPYRVRASVVLGNNPLNSYPNQQLVHRALLNQDLLVVHELFMTPTAQLADYVLPGDVFTERSNLHDAWNWTNRLQISQKVVEPPAQASSVFQFWRDLAHRMGYGEHFPWETVEELIDHRLSPSGCTFEQFAAERYMQMGLPEYRKYRKTGFATPSGKVELHSSILEDFGFDPLPYHREPPACTDDYPLRLFIGVREDPYFQSGQRQIARLRKKSPAPYAFIHPVDARRAGLRDNDWANVSTPHGSIVAKVSIQDSMKEGHLRVPRGWWFPEMPRDSELSGVFLSADARLVADSDDYLDYEQGVPAFKGFPGRITKLNEPPDLLADLQEGAHRG